MRKTERKGYQMDNGASSYRRFLNGDDEGLTLIIKDYKDGLIMNSLHIDSSLTTTFEALKDGLYRVNENK
jgi:RNA polymerase sigma-70 factor (ECF subfamily)